MTNTVEATWKTYQDAWGRVSAEERKRLLSASVAANCHYSSPPSEAQGLAALTAEIAAFQQQFPGASFRTHRLQTHHGRLLAEWVLYDAGGNEVQPGTSFARLDGDGRLVDLNGFFAA